ncbi:MAG: EAL domain-containing protein [Acidimicrobiia bacterium]
MDTWAGTTHRAAGGHADLEALLARGAVRAVFQPIVRLSDGGIVGYEGLARMAAQPELPPDVWLDLADDAGLREDLELACLEAIAEVGSPPDDALLFVNASSALLSHPLTVSLRERLPERLVIELTERERVADYGALRAEILLWQSSGVRLAIDHTGSGWSTLRHVVQLHPDFIKLDRSLVHGVDLDRNSRALVCALAAFARESGITVVAEGVERFEELEVLREADIDLAQGFLFARPGPPWPSAADRSARRSGGSDGGRKRSARTRLEDHLLGATSPEHACDVAVRHLFLLGGVMPSVYLERGGLLRCHAQRGLWQILDGMPPGSGVTGQAFARGDSVVLQDIRQSPDYLEAIPGVVSECCVPIVAGDCVVGSLNIESYAPLARATIDEAGHAAMLLGQRLAEIGLHSSQSPHQRLARHAAILSELVEHPMLSRRVVEAAMEVSGMDSAAVAIADSDGTLHVDETGGPLAAVLLDIAPDDLARLGALVEQVASCYTAGDSMGAGFVGTEGLRAAGARAVVVVPLIARGRRLGILVAAGTIPTALKPDEAETIELLGTHAATCLDNAATLVRLRDQTQRDPLTGLRNRSAFHDQLDGLLSADEQPAPWAVLLADIDRFKGVNDNSGHLVGDDVLVEVGEALRSSLRSQDRAFRVGGDEFAAIVRDAGISHALTVAQRVIGAANVELARHGAALSIGVAGARRGDNPSSLLERADRALYHAKRNHLGAFSQD